MMTRHWLRLAVAVLAALLLQPCVQALSQTGDVIRRIVVEGNRAHRAQHRRELSGVAARRAFRPTEARPVAEEPVRHRPVRRRDDRPRGRCRWWSRWSRTRSSTASRSRATSGSRPRCWRPRSSCGRAWSTPAPRVQNAVSRILELYRRNGRYAAKVEPKIIELDQNRVDLVFEIDEGPVTGVGGITFIGNEQFSDSTLRGVVQTRESAWYRFLHHRRHLRPRPGLLRRGAAAALLHGARLCRFPGGLRDRRADPGRQGVLHHLHRSRRGRNTSSARSRSRRRCATSATEQLRRLGREHQGRRLQCRAGRIDHPGPDRRDRPARLRLRRDPAAADQESRDPDRRHHLPDQRGPAGLCRADRHQRQSAHAGRGDPARVPAGRGRRLQHRAAAALAAAAAQSRLLRIGRRQDRAGQRARQGRDPDQGGRALDRRAVVRRRLLDPGRRARRHLG